MSEDLPIQLSRKPSLGVILAILVQVATVLVLLFVPTWREQASWGLYFEKKAWIAVLYLIVAGYGLYRSATQARLGLLAVQLLIFLFLFICFMAWAERHRPASPPNGFQRVSHIAPAAA